MGTFTAGQGEFLLDGSPFRVLAGGMHYFRVVSEYWEDRLRKLKAMGLNTVETYIAWNLHEPRPGEFRFEHDLDLERYIRLAAELGLYVILRPGPYICSERDLGGLPSWLLKDSGMRLRCLHRPYLDAVDRYFDELLPRLAPLQISQGGPIIAMQVENEYGSYGNDTAYIRYLRDGIRAGGVDALLFTADGATDTMLQGGSLPDELKTANFGSNAVAAFAKLREYQPAAPLMCTEFWDGWFDHWGESHHTRAPEDAATALAEILGAGASVVMYMFHGGTNFGFGNGANYPPPNWEEQSGYQPTVTSYDFDAPLDEAGDVTPKYAAFREVLRDYTSVPDTALPKPAPKLDLGSVALPASVSLQEALPGLGAALERTVPEPMEALDQDYGFILYRTRVSGPRPEAPLTIRHVRDRALVFADGAALGVLERNRPEDTIPLSVPPAGLTLEILVENMGRINYGPELHDRKGITEGVLLGQQFLYHWSIRPLPLDDLSGLGFAPGPATDGPRFFRGTFTVPAPRDTFLALPGWRKGVCWVNGRNLGRYWDIGPQKTLYVPGPWLRAGENELVVFELHGCREPRVEFRDRPDLGG